MPDETNAPDRFLAEIERQLVLRGRERTRALALIRKRLAAYEAEERKGGASETQARDRSLARLGAPKEVADELAERALSARVTRAAHALLGGLIAVSVGLTVIGWRVVEMRRYRHLGTAGITSEDVTTSWDGFFHHFAALDLWLPPRNLTLRLVVAAACVLVVLGLAEVAAALARDRCRSATILATLAGVGLLAGVCAQLSFAIHWNRFGQGHGGWLVAALVIEVVVVLAAIVPLARPLRDLLPPRLSPLARPRMLILISVAALSAVALEAGFAQTRLCPPGFGGCHVLSPPWMENANSPVWVQLFSSPTGSPGAVALKGRVLAVAATAYAEQPPGDSLKTPGGSLSVVVWEGRWPADARGPCGSTNKKANAKNNPLSPHTNIWCDLRQPESHPGVRWRRVDRVAVSEPGPVALGYRGDRRLALAYHRDGATLVAGAPSWRAVRVLEGKALSLRVAPTGKRDLVLAAIVEKGNSKMLALTRSKGGSWSPTRFVTATGSKLALASSGSQIAILYRDRRHRLVFELRTLGLDLLARRDLGAGTQGALGNLRGNRIGIAALEPLGPGEKRLSLSAVRRGRLSLLTRKRMGRKEQNICRGLVGVVQTGEIARAVFREYNYISPRARRGILQILGRPGELSADWPRYVALLGSESVSDRVSWTVFELSLGQPPELQLARIEAQK